MFSYRAFLSDCDRFELSANYDDNDKFYMPSLTIKENGEEVDLWDNDNYLMEELYPYLCGDRPDRELYNFFESKELEKELKEMFDSAIACGMFDEYIERKKKRDETK